MKRLAILSILMVSVMFFSAGSTLAFNDSSKVILTVPTGIVDAGDEVDVEVHVFDKGAYASPTVVQAFDSSRQEISLTEKKAGVWKGVVEAQEDTISANIEINELSDTTGLPIRVNPDALTDTMDIEIEAKDPGALANPGPGDKLDFTISVYKNGVLKDESSLEVFAYRSDTGDDTKLAINKVSTGVYETSYTVPTVTTSTYFHISTEASQAGTTYSSTIGNFWVNFYQVWYKKQAITTTESTFDVYVADLNGKAVEGAVLKLKYNYDQTDSWNTIHEDGGQATTDKDGKASYTITYTKVDREVYLDGTVSKDGKIQDFSGDIIITPAPNDPGDGPEEPQGWGLECIYQGNIEDTIKPGKRIQLVYKAYFTEGLWGGDPIAWAEKDIYYYIYTYTSIVSTGKVTSDKDGLFTLDFTAPLISAEYDILMLEFESETAVGEFSSATGVQILAQRSVLDYLENPELLKDNDLKISIDQLKVGGKSKVTATLATAMKGTTARVSWVPGKLNMQDLMDWGDTQPDWEYLSGEGTYEMSKKGSSFTTEIVIPEFMPKSTYTIYVVALDPYDDDDISFNIFDSYHVNYIQLQAGEGGSTGGGGGGKDGGMLGMGQIAGVDTVLILLLVVIIIVVVVVIVVAKKQRSTPDMHYQPPGAPHHPAPPAQQPAPDTPPVGPPPSGDQPPQPPSGDQPPQPPSGDQPPQPPSGDQPPPSGGAYSPPPPPPGQ